MKKSLYWPYGRNKEYTKKMYLLHYLHVNIKVLKITRSVARFNLECIFFLERKIIITSKIGFMTESRVPPPIGNRKDVTAALVTCILIHSLHININLIQ